MTYVPKYPHTRMAEPKSVHGFVLRLRKLTKDISTAPDHRTKVICRMTRSFWLVRAERRFDTARMLEICFKAGLRSEQSDLDAHRRIAEHCYEMFEVAHRLPNNEEAISVVIEGRHEPRVRIKYHLVYPHLSINRLRQVVRYSRAAFAFDELRQRPKRF